MKKIKYALMLSMLSCIFLGAGACGSSGGSDSSSSTDALITTINGFDIAETVEVNEREMVDVNLPIVTDGHGNVLDVVYEVTTKDGGYVGTSAGKFFVADTQGYVIRYIVIGKDGATYEKTTTVNVKSSLQLELSAEFDVFVESGVEASISPVCSFDDPVYSYAVTNKTTGANIQVSEDGVYVCEETGWYTVDITASAGETEASYSYEVYCRQAMQEGEVEVFGADWETVRMLQNYGTYNAKYTTTAESGVKDRFGLDSEFLRLETRDFIEYANLYINPRGNESYYRQLAEEGYTHVSFWIYSECGIPHDIMLQLFPTKGLYTFDIGSVMPNKWVEMKVNLVEDKAYYESCFSAAVEYFQKQETPVLQFDNTNGWNGPNGSYGFESDMTFYISSVYAVKPSGIEVNEEAETVYETGETVNLSDLFAIPEGMSVQYAVTYNGETVPASKDYTFYANGTYEVSVIPAANLSCDETVTLTVTDGVIASVVSVQKERTIDGQISLSDLGVTFSLNGEMLSATGYKVLLDGQEIPTADDTFTATQDGGYIVEYEVPYQIGEEEYISYVQVKIDVWSEASKYLVSDTAHIFASSEYCGASNWDKQPTYEAGVYTVGGKTGNMLKISGIGEALLVPFKPVYTKAYYQSILEAMPEAKLLVEYYVTPQESGISARCYTGGYLGGAPAYEKWNTSAISLADFINDYDMLSEGYDEIKYLKDNDIVQTHSRNENDYLLWMTGAGHLNKVTIYVSEIYVVEKVEVQNDGLWNDLSNADALSTTINPWVTVQATRYGLVGADEVASIGGVDGALYTKVSANVGWFCYGGYQIKPALTIKDAWQSFAEKDLVFDWYYNITDDAENTYNYNVSVYGKANAAYAQDTWHTSRISMADLLADWDDVVAGSNNQGESSPWTPWLQFRYTTAAHAEQAGVVYLGNIRFEEHIEGGDEGGGDEGGEDETPKFWNNLASTDAIKTTANRWYHTIPALPTASEIAEIGGENGATYLRVDGGSGFFMYAGYKILPTGEKADYEQYAGLTLLFDWYYSIPSLDAANYAVSIYGAADAQFAEGTWYTVMIAIDDLLAEWDNLIDNSDPMSLGTPWLDFNWVSGQGDEAGVLYIGNIRLGGEAPEKPVVPEIDEVTVSQTLRYETSATTNIDLLALYTANGGTSDLSALTLTATFTPAEGAAITVNDPASVLVADIGVGTYSVTVETSDGVTVLTATVEIYTEAQTEIEVDEITVTETILIETAETPSLDLTAIYVEKGGTTSIEDLNEIGLIAKLSAPYGATTVDNVTQVDVANLAKGVYTVELKTTTGILVMTATIDVYAAADGLVWQSINENSVAYARIWKYGYLNVGEATYATVGNVNVLQFTTVKAGEANTNQVGLRLKALHSKAYYTLMSESYESVTFDVYATNGGLNIKTCEDSATNGGWHSNNTWKTYTVSLAYLLEHWDTLNDLTSTNDTGASVTQLITTFWGEDNTHVVSIGNFGAVAKATEEPEQPGDGGEETSIVWNDLSSTDAIKTTANRWNHTIPAIATSTEIAAIGGVNGAAYLRVNGGGEYFTYAAYKILPSGAKADYEAYANYVLEFDWYFDIPDYEGGLNVQTYGETASTLRAQDTWYTVTISMADLLAEWDNLIDDSNPMSKGTPWVDFNWTSNSANKDAVLYIGNIRIKAVENESSDLPVWNDLSSTDAIKTTANRWNHTVPAIATASEIAAIGGVNGAAYLRVDGGGEYFTYAAYKILPSADKSAYEAYADYNVVFDWYFDIPDYEGGLNVQTYGETASTLRAQDTWYTVTISLADLLAEWDNLIDDSNPMSKGTPWIDFNWTSNSANKDAVLYIGNIRLEKAA
ncbi:MAG: hypothetical protein IJX30_02270 [Clostridia bacterium]|nr:hypothetical protein [Clostridia bacterium]